jgi:hypothetical protein
MADVVDKFYARTNNQRINSCGGILGECVAGVQSYTNVELGIGGCPAFPVAYAYQMFGTRTDAFDWVRNTPSGIPPRGSIMVWNSNTGGGAGHTGVIVSANVNTFDCYQQNDPRGTGMRVKTYNYANVIGWAIPKGGQLNPQGAIVMNREAGYELYRTGLHREAENAGVADQWNGLAPAEALKRVRASNEWKFTNDFTKNYPAMAAENVKLKTDMTGLQAEIKRLNERIVELEKLVKDLDNQLDQQNQDSANLNKLGEILKWLIDRLGLSKK